MSYVMSCRESLLSKSTTEEPISGSKASTTSSTCLIVCGNNFGWISRPLRMFFSIFSKSGKKRSGKTELPIESRESQQKNEVILYHLQSITLSQVSSDLSFRMSSFFQRFWVSHLFEAFLSSRPCHHQSPAHNQLLVRHRAGRPGARRGHGGQPAPLAQLRVVALAGREGRALVLAAFFFSESWAVEKVKPSLEIEIKNRELKYSKGHDPHI